MAKSTTVFFDWGPSSACRKKRGRLQKTAFKQRRTIVEKIGALKVYRRRDNRKSESSHSWTGRNLGQ